MPEQTDVDPAVQALQGRCALRQALAAIESARTALAAADGALSALFGPDSEMDLGVVFYDLGEMQDMVTEAARRFGRRCRERGIST